MHEKPVRKSWLFSFIPHSAWDMVMMQKTVGDGLREEGPFTVPPAAASRSRRAWLCEAASPLLLTFFRIEVQIPFNEIPVMFQGKSAVYSHVIFYVSKERFKPI